MLLMGLCVCVCSVLTSPAFGNIELRIEPLCDCGCDAETVSCFSILYTPYTQLLHHVGLLESKDQVCVCVLCVCVFCVDKRGRDTCAC